VKASHRAWVFAACLAAGVPAAAAAQPPQAQQASKSTSNDSHRRKWWMDDRMRAELAITDQQSAAIEAVWEQSVPHLRELRQQVDQLDNTISQMIRDAVDEPTIVAQLDRAESVRAEFNKGRTLMLYRMNRVLTADQRAKLKAMWEREHGGSDRRRP
jgi:Spy/CpxP family protein refolding chaperone